jgi:hypothetical protein
MPGDTLANVNALSGQKAQFGGPNCSQAHWDKIFGKKPKKKAKK